MLPSNLLTSGIFITAKTTNSSQQVVSLNLPRNTPQKRQKKKNTIFFQWKVFTNLFFGPKQNSSAQSWKVSLHPHLRWESWATADHPTLLRRASAWIKSQGWELDDFFRTVEGTLPSGFPAPIVVFGNHRITVSTNIQRTECWVKFRYVNMYNNLY